VTEFIFMLTREDRTVANAIEVYQQVRSTSLRWVGFKDIGLPVSTLRKLAADIRNDGRHCVLEVVSEDPASELASIAAGIDIGVDLIMGGTGVDQAIPVLAGSGTRYFPFPGRIVGHPSRLVGSIDEIAASASAIASREGVHGLDLLAYRFDGDVPALIGAVAAAVSVPIVAAGSVDTLARVRTVQEHRLWAFTIGSAIFDGRFHGRGIREQVETVLRAIGSSPMTGGSTLDPIPGPVTP
jgi:hypothetical protein